MRKLSTILVLFLASMVAVAQDSTPPPAPPEGQSQGAPDAMHRGHRPPGVMGVITAINGSTLTVKNMEGQTTQVALSDKTEFKKDRQPAKLSDFKVGDGVMVRGSAGDDSTVQAEMVATRSDSGQRGQNMRENMGKKFIAGEVKAINGTQLTIARKDGVTQTVTVDENTSFKKDGDSITLADIKVGDNVYGRGELKGEVFVPANLNVGQPRPMGNWNHGDENGPR